MSTRNNDSSLLTKRRQAGVLSAYYNNLQATINAGGAAAANVRSEQPTQQSLAVVTERKQGTCICNGTDAYNQGNAPGRCGCGTS